MSAPPARRPGPLARLIEPDAALTDISDRHRARVLTAIVAAIVPLGFLSLVIQLATVPGFATTFAANTGALVLLAGLLGLIRSRHYRVGATIAMVVVVAACAVAGLLDAADPVWWAYPMIAVLLATLLLSLRVAVVIALVAAAAVLGVHLWHGAPTDAIVARLSFHAVYAPLLLLVAHQRNQIEATRQRELRLHAVLLEQVQRQARIGHWRALVGSAEIEPSPELEALLGIRGPRAPLDDVLARFEAGRRDALRELLATAPERPSSLELGCHRADGRDAVAVVTVTALAASADGVVVTVQDVTERIEAERERAALIARLLGAQRLEAIGQIAGGVAHDFNNLLTVMATTVELMAAASAEERRGLVADHGDAVARAGKLVKQLLDYARREERTPLRVDLRGLLEDMAPLLRRLVPGRCELRCELASAPVLAASAELEQVILNLVSNAAAVIGADGVVAVSVLADAAGDGVVLEVRDDGPGIPDDVQAHIFEPFFTTKGPHGTGLGLATVQRIVERCGGTIALRSHVGAGTTMRVRLPRAPAAAVRPDLAAVG